MNDIQTQIYKRIINSCDTNESPLPYHVDSPFYHQYHRIVLELKELGLVSMIRVHNHWKVAPLSPKEIVKNRLG